MWCSFGKSNGLLRSNNNIITITKRLYAKQNDGKVNERSWMNSSNTGFTYRQMCTYAYVIKTNYKKSITVKKQISLSSEFINKRTSCLEVFTFTHGNQMYGISWKRESLAQTIIVITLLKTSPTAHFLLYILKDHISQFHYLVNLFISFHKSIVWSISKSHTITSIFY